MNPMGPYEYRGEPSWKFDFVPKTHSLPYHVDVATVGGEFTCPAAVAWLRRRASWTVVALFECYHVGPGAGGRLFFHANALIPSAIVLGGYTGHGVVLSVHPGRGDFPGSRGVAGVGRQTRKGVGRALPVWHGAGLW